LYLWLRTDGRYAFDLALLGVLLSQVWHWYTWSTKERNFIRVLVVSAPDTKRTQVTDKAVLGLGLLDRDQYIHLQLDDAPLRRQLWSILSIRRQLL
jgi:hypothetical protein